MSRLSVYKICLIVTCALGLAAGCGPKRPSHHQITSINIIDRNGLSETISSKDRLDLYQNVNFLESQPYQKVMRVFGRCPDGSIRSCITSYHPNRQIRQYLEAINGRACGWYREWYSNGQLELEARIVGGIADIHSAAEQSWLFDGLSRAWDDSGRLLAAINYSKGDLEGESVYYYPCGSIWKRQPYKNNLLNGTMEIYHENGNLQQITQFCAGLSNGFSKQFWPDKSVACDELFTEGLLCEGSYFDEKGGLIATVHEKNGWRVVFHDDGKYQLQEYQGGKQEGVVKILDQNQHLYNSYFLKEGLKDGEELVYPDPDRCLLDGTNPSAPILSVYWCKGVIQGVVKTWYPNGQIESQKEMSLNKKNGMSMAWYKNGSIMMVEEYHNDCLTRGEYFRKDDRFPVSKVVKGKGVATIYDADGHFLRKVNYQNGRVLE